MSDLTEMFETVTGCCLHNPVWLPADVRSEVAWIGDRQNGSDSSSIVIVRLNGPKGPGDWGLFTQMEDYTGHGCQCGSFTAREPTLAALLGHLDEYDLMRVVERGV